MTKLMHDGLSEACRETARVVLSKKGNSSSDLVETLAEKYYEIAESHQDFVSSELDSDAVIEHAVRYIAHVHASPLVGTDTDWFRDTLAALMKLAVPDTELTVEAGKFLPCLPFPDSLAYFQMLPMLRTRGPKTQRPARDSHAEKPSSLPRHLPCRTRESVRSISLSMG